MWPRNKMQLTICISFAFWCKFVSSQTTETIEEHQYRFVYERLEEEYCNTDFYRGNITVRKVNRTSVKTDIYFETYKLLDHQDADTQFDFYKLNHLQQYAKQTSLKNIDFCVVIQTGQLGLDQFLKNTNAPKECPLLPNKYYLKDIILSTDLSKYKVPQMMANNIIGKWKIQVTFSSVGNVYSILNFYAAIEKIVKW